MASAVVIVNHSWVWDPLGIILTRFWEKKKEKKVLYFMGSPLCEPVGCARADGCDLCYLSDWCYLRDLLFQGFVQFIPKPGEFSVSICSIRALKQVGIPVDGIAVGGISVGGYLWEPLGLAHLVRTWC